MKAELSEGSLDTKERLLELRMLEAKIRVQESLYGMNLVKTVSIGGAAVSGILNLLGIRFSKAPVETKMEVTTTGISVESRPVAREAHARRSTRAQPRPTPKPTEVVIQPAPAPEPSFWAQAADNVYIIFAAVFVAILVSEFVVKKMKKEEKP